eukprot:evm.model.scf_18.11 EVM.evm.TU.scf_18.11   scf_18:70932-75972(+)
MGMNDRRSRYGNQRRASVALKFLAARPSSRQNSRAVANGQPLTACSLLRDRMARTRSMKPTRQVRRSPSPSPSPPAGAMHRTHIVASTLRPSVAFGRDAVAPAVLESVRSGSGTLRIELLVPANLLIARRLGLVKASGPGGGARPRKGNDARVKVFDTVPGSRGSGSSLKKRAAKSPQPCHPRTPVVPRGNRTKSPWGGSKGDGSDLSGTRIRLEAPSRRSYLPRHCKQKALVMGPASRPTSQAAGPGAGAVAPERAGGEGKAGGTAHQRMLRSNGPKLQCSTSEGHRSGFRHPGMEVQCLQTPGATHLMKSGQTRHTNGKETGLGTGCHSVRTQMALPREQLQARQQNADNDNPGTAEASEGHGGSRTVVVSRSPVVQVAVPDSCETQFTTAILGICGPPLTHSPTDPGSMGGALAGSKRSAEDVASQPADNNISKLKRRSTDIPSPSGRRLEELHELLSAYVECQPVAGTGGEHRDRLVIGVLESPQSPLAWLNFIKHEEAWAESKRVKNLSETLDIHRCVSSPSLYDVHVRALRLLLPAADRSSEALFELYMRLAGAQRRNGDDARMTYQIMDALGIGTMNSELYTAWATMECHAGNAQGAEAVVKKGFHARAQPLRNLYSLQQQIRANALQEHAPNAGEEQFLSPIRPIGSWD